MPHSRCRPVHIRPSHAEGRSRHRRPTALGIRRARSEAQTACAGRARDPGAGQAQGPWWARAHPMKTRASSAFRECGASLFHVGRCLEWQAGRGASDAISHRVDPGPPWPERRPHSPTPSRHQAVRRRRLQSFARAACADFIEPRPPKSRRTLRTQIKPSSSRPPHGAAGGPRRSSG